MNQITIGPITIDDTVSAKDLDYVISYWDNRIQVKRFGRTNEEDAEFPLHIPREVVKQEAIKRGKMIGHIPAFGCEVWDGEEVMHEVTFEEWEEDVDYREEFNKFIQELAIERLNLNVFRELEKYKALAVTENKMVVIYQSKINNINPQYCTVKKQA